MPQSLVNSLCISVKNLLSLIEGHGSVIFFMLTPFRIRLFELKINIGEKDEVGLLFSFYAFFRRFFFEGSHAFGNY